MSLQELMKEHSFSTNPFRTWVSEDESELAEWFVPPPFFATILGDTFGPSKKLVPVSSLVFGTPGNGKTALRKMIEFELLRRADPFMVLRYSDFGRVVSSSAQPTLSDHVEELIRLGTVALLGFWSESEARYSNLNTSDRCELAGLVFHYYENLNPEVKKLYTNDLSPMTSRLIRLGKVGTATAVDLYNAAISVIKKEKIEPTNWKREDASNQPNPLLRLQRFWGLAKAMGTSAIFVLIDSIDEAPDVRNGEDIFKLISELLLSQHVLEFRDQDEQVLCFKIFLTRPEEIIPLLEKYRFRRDRIETRKIEWKRAELDLALKRRLAHYSNQQILNFDSLCEAGLSGTHDLMLDSCKLSPRVLFRVAHEIFAAFQRNKELDTSATKLDKRSIDEGIKAGLESVMS